MQAGLIKVGLVLAGSIIAVAAGFHYGKGAKEIERVEVKGETVIQWKDRIVTHEVIKTVQPDGTVTEVVRDTSRDTEQNSKETSSSIAESVKSRASKYTLGLYAGPVSAKDGFKEGVTSYDYKRDWQLEGSIRIFSAVWGSVLVSPFNKSLALGVRLEF